MVARTAFVPGNTNHIALMNQLVGMRNLIINGGFTINQRAYVSGAVLASGAYGHDRWKGGAGGGDYSFTQLPNYTAITIAANKSLIQVIEDRNVVGGQYLCPGPAPRRRATASTRATPSGSYVNSPIVIAGQNAGTTMSVEFANGASPARSSYPQLELGLADPTDFEVRHDLIEKMLAWRYCFSLGKTNGMPLVDGGNDSTTAFLGVTSSRSRCGPTPTLVTTGTATDYGCASSPPAHRSRARRCRRSAPRTTRRRSSTARSPLASPRAGPQRCGPPRPRDSCGWSRSSKRRNHHHLTTNGRRKRPFFIFRGRGTKCASCTRRTWRSEWLG
jgi:hypothetical protein